MPRLKFYQIRINDTSMTIPNIMGWFLAPLIRESDEQTHVKKDGGQFSLS